MSLQQISYQEEYRSGQNNIIEEFFRPSLCEASRYWRAVGYFSSSALEAFGRPLDDFVKRDGKIRLITSVQLMEDDLHAIEKGLSKQDISEKRIDEVIEEQFRQGVGNGVSRLASLLEIGRLEIKIAVPKIGTGIYHEKVGVFFDENDYVAFSGSSNESRNAFENNYECIDVYPSWEISSRASRKLKHFDNLWNNEDPGAEVYSFPEAAKQKLIRICKERKEGDQGGSGDGGILKPEDQGEKWRHQSEALKIFLKYERGVLNMATGTGKTRTALKIMTELLYQDSVDTVVIAADGNDLLDQWYGEILRWRRDIWRNLVIFRHYSEYHGSEDYTLDPINAVFLTSRMQLSQVLVRLEDTVKRRMLLCVVSIYGTT